MTRESVPTRGVSITEALDPDPHPAGGIPRFNRGHLLPYGDHLFNAFGPVNDLVEVRHHNNTPAGLEETPGPRVVTRAARTRSRTAGR